MKKIIRLTESDLNRIIKSVLNEGVSESTIDTVVNSHPAGLPAGQFYEKIIPKQYEIGRPKGWWANSCAAKMSVALLGAGYKPGGQYYTEKDISFGGSQIPKNSAFNPASQSFKTIFRRIFGEPTITLETTGGKPNGWVPEEIKGRKGVYVFSTDAWSDAKGHVDAWDGVKSAGGHEYFSIPGTWEFWLAPKQVELNAKSCGWGNDVEGYKKANWKCYDEELKNNKSCPAVNAKKCGWGNNVKAYRESGWFCKK
jgi:hypothetical protein